MQLEKMTHIYNHTFPETGNVLKTDNQNTP